MERFGFNFSIPENFSFDTCETIEYKFGYALAKDFDRENIKAIRQCAKEAGLVGITIWNQDKIVKALKKALPEQVVMTEDECLCPSCGFDMMGVLDYDPKHCPECGQKLVWGD